jgi:hypothetical protein
MVTKDDLLQSRRASTGIDKLDTKIDNANAPFDASL